MKRVIFEMEDSGYGAELLDNFDGLDKLKTCFMSISDKLFLFGTIIKLTKGGKGGTLTTSYDVQWEDTLLGKMTIALQALIVTIALAESTSQQQQNTFKTPSPPPSRRKIGSNFSPQVQQALLLVDEGEEGTPFKSETEECDEDEDVNANQFARNEVPTDFDDLIHPQNASKQIREEPDYKGLSRQSPMTRMDNFVGQRRAIFVILPKSLIMYQAG
jgi:hypothetical protein